MIKANLKIFRQGGHMEWGGYQIFRVGGQVGQMSIFFYFYYFNCFVKKHLLIQFILVGWGRGRSVKMIFSFIFIDSPL